LIDLIVFGRHSLRAVKLTPRSQRLSNLSKNKIADILQSRSQTSSLHFVIRVESAGEIANGCNGADADHARRRGQNCALDMILVLIPTIHATTFWLAPYQAPASHVRRAKRAVCSRPLSWVRTHGAANRCDIADPSVGSTNGSYQQSLRLSQLASCRQALHAM
jgi:hypothetical protein